VVVPGTPTTTLTVYKKWLGIDHTIPFDAINLPSCTQCRSSIVRSGVVWMSSDILPRRY